jgi:hypothetical protein
MIFQHTLDKVLSGWKVQTRRVWKVGEFLIDDAVVGDGRLKWKVGETYAVQPGRGKASVGRIRITGIRLEPVTAISETDASAEGFASRDDFLATWREIHGGDHHDVWVIEFRLVE